MLQHNRQPGLELGSSATPYGKLARNLRSANQGKVPWNVTELVNTVYGMVPSYAGTSDLETCELRKQCPNQASRNRNDLLGDGSEHWSAS